MNENITAMATFGKTHSFFSSTDISEQEPNTGGENKRSAMLILYFCVLIMGGLVQKGAGQLQELFFSFGGEHP